MEEETRYKSAMAMASTMGGNKSKLLESANHYLQVLSKEKEKFAAATESQKAKKITGQEASITKLQNSIEAKRQKIEALKKEIELDEKKMEEKKNAINEAATKVQQTSDNFHYAYRVVTGQILADIENMKKFLS